MTAERIRPPGGQKVGRDRVVRCPADGDREPTRSGRMTPPRHFRERIRFFTVAEVAEHLSVSTRTIRRWIESCELVAHRFGRAVRIGEGDLRAFLATHRDS